MISILSTLFVGEWAIRGETLVCSETPPSNAILVADLISNRALLHDVMRRHANYLGVRGTDLRPVTSDWSLRYLWALLPPVTAAMSVLHHRFPVSRDDIGVALHENGTPLRFHIVNEGISLPDSDTAARYDTLLRHHLEPLFEAISDVTRLPKKILWGNTARYLEIILDQALLLTGNASHIAEDKAALLQRSAYSNGRRNPLHAAQREITCSENNKPVTISLHRQCCLAYLLPEQNHCSACPLAPQYREIIGSEPL